jgi:hypothetical protein
MPSKIKITAGFADKVTENYQSQQYSIGLEMECQINGNTAEIEDASKRLFALCRKIVNAQKTINVDYLLQQDSIEPPTNGSAPTTSAAPAQPTASAPANAQPAQPPAPAPQNNGNGNGSTKLATDKQIKYLFRLAMTAGLKNDEVRHLPQGIL